MRRKIAFVSLLPYHTKCWLFVIWLQIFYSWLLVYINNSVYVAFMPSSVKCGLQFLRSRTYWWNQNPFLEVCCCFYLSVLLKANKSSCRLPAVCKDDDDFFFICLLIYFFITYIQCQSEEDLLDQYLMVSETFRRKQVSIFQNVQVKANKMW